MKTILSTPLLLLGLAALPALAPAQGSLPPPPPVASADLAAPAPAEPGLRFNFRGAPLETVLKYMSDAAGYVIVLDTPVHGTVDMWSTQPVSKDEAVQLLNLALNKNGYTARTQGRTLIVSTKDDARKQNIPIRTGNDPAEIPETADMVMQIIPLSHIDATQAAKDLGSLLPSSATLTANQDSNALIVTDTQINVHHIVELVAALDTSIDTASTVHVFHLKNADPTEMAQLLTSLFATSTTTPQTPTFGAGFPGRFAGGFARFFGNGVGGAPAAATGSTTRANGTASGSRSNPVVAVADPRTYSIVVTASKTQMPEIAHMIAQLDADSPRQQKVFVYTLENADVNQVATILQNLFQSSNTRSSSSTQADPLSTRASNNSQTTQTTPSLSLGSSSSSRLP